MQAKLSIRLPLWLHPLVAPSRKQVRLEEVRGQLRPLTVRGTVQQEAGQAPTLAEVDCHIALEVEGVGFNLEDETAMRAESPQRGAKVGASGSLVGIGPEGAGNERSRHRLVLHAEERQNAL
jgi:hypothetical protein